MTDPSEPLCLAHLIINADDHVQRTEATKTAEDFINRLVEEIFHAPKQTKSQLQMQQQQQQEQQRDKKEHRKNKRIGGS
jgi:hypothetical protein